MNVMRAKTADVSRSGHTIRQDTSSFEHMLSLVDIVSFDLFDTLVHRKGLFSPKDLFYEIQHRAEKLLHIRLDDFAAIRVRCEERARTYAWGKRLQETSLDAIYVEIGRMYHLDSSAIERVKALELECEREALIFLESGRKLFAAAIAAGKTVVIVSDTYFEEEFISEIVRQQGYTPERIYVSSAHGKSKVDGSLYDVVLRDLGCAPNRLLHVGDNQLVDVTMALGKGIRTFFVPTPKHYFKWQCGLGDQPSGNPVISTMLYDISQVSYQNRQNKLNPTAQTATEHLALLNIAYAIWLIKHLRQGGYKRVYFAAREGLFLKRCFDLVADRMGFDIDSRYLYVSRASLYPSLIFTDVTMARRVFSHSWDHLTIADALQRISLRVDECAPELARHKIADPTLRLGYGIADQFSAFLDDIWPVLEQKHQDHYQLIVDYLHQEKVLTDEKAAFVDIGWHGSLQNCLLKIIDHSKVNKQLSGYYLGTFEKPAGATKDFKSLGYLVNNGESASIAHLVRFGPSLLELFHTAAHGSVLGYERVKSRIVPRLQHNPIEMRQYAKSIESLQNGIYEVIVDRLSGKLDMPLETPDPSLIARAALRVIYAPTAAEATTFGYLQIASDFGGHMKSITGVSEWDLTQIEGEFLPDGQFPIWRPGFAMLKRLALPR